MSKNIVIGYSPNDFFYTQATGNLIPSESSCAQLASQTEWETRCNSINFADNIETCIKKELCSNKENHDLLLGINNGHSGSDEKYLNTKTMYNRDLLNSINLGVGVFVLAGMCFYYRNK